MEQIIPKKNIPTKYMQNNIHMYIYYYRWLFFLSKSTVKNLPEKIKQTNKYNNTAYVTTNVDNKGCE